MNQPDVIEAPPATEAAIEALYPGTELAEPVKEAPREKLQPEDIATRDYQHILPMFQTTSLSLSKKGLYRVVNELMEYPFNYDSVRLSDKTERRAFILGANLLDCKHVLMQAALRMKKEQTDKLVKDEMERREAERNAEPAAFQNVEEEKEVVPDGK